MQQNGAIALGAEVHKRGSNDPPYTRGTTSVGAACCHRPLWGSELRSVHVSSGSGAPDHPRREQPFACFSPIAPAERPVRVIERSLEIRHGERQVAALRKGPVVKIECPDPACCCRSVIEYPLLDTQGRTENRERTRDRENPKQLRPDIASNLPDRGTALGVREIPNHQ